PFQLDASANAPCTSTTVAASPLGVSDMSASLAVARNVTRFAPSPADRAVRSPARRVRRSRRGSGGPAARRSSNLLHIHVGALRRQIEADPARPGYLITERGTGLRLVGVRRFRAASGSDSRARQHPPQVDEHLRVHVLAARRRQNL